MFEIKLETIKRNEEEKNQKKLKKKKEKYVGEQ